MTCRPWTPVWDGLPTWIPQLSRSAFAAGAKGVFRRVNADSLVGRPGVGSTPYRASGGSKAYWKPVPSSEESLVVRGFVLDTIKDKMDPATAGIIPKEWMQAAGWTDSERHPPDLLWWTLVGNRDAHGQRSPSHWLRACRDAFKRGLVGGTLHTGEVMMHECLSMTREFLERVQCIVWPRRLILFNRFSPRESLGLAPTSVKKGDLVCILNGCSVPVVLRKFVDGANAAKRGCGHPNCPKARIPNASIHSDPGLGGYSKVHYELIGECYVHGMMEGEAFDIQRLDHIRLQDFELR